MNVPDDQAPPEPPPEAIAPPEALPPPPPEASPLLDPSIHVMHLRATWPTQGAPDHRVVTIPPGAGRIPSGLGVFLLKLRVAGAVRRWRRDVNARRSSSPPAHPPHVVAPPAPPPVDVVLPDPSIDVFRGRPLGRRRDQVGRCPALGMSSSHTGWAVASRRGADQPWAFGAAGAGQGVGDDMGTCRG